MFKFNLKAVIGAAALLWATPSAAQSALDRADPAVVEEELSRPPKPAPDVKTPFVTEPHRPAVQGIDQRVMVGAIRVEGVTALPQAAFAQVIERYAGRTLAPDQLQALAGEVAGIARAAGYGLATAGVPRQQVSNGILRVILDEGRIDEVRADGDAAAAVNRMLAPLADGKAVRTARLERQLLLAGDLPGTRLGPARIDRRGGRNILRLRAERVRSQGRLNLDNWGSGAVGPLRAHLSGEANGVLADGDQLSVGGVVTPLEPEEFGLIRAGYSGLLGRDGTEASVHGYLARSRLDGSFDGISGGGKEAAVSLSHPFLRSRAASVRGEIEFAVRDATQERRDTRLREDRIATLTASMIASGALGPGQARTRLAIVQGLDALGATQEGDPLASRPDGSGTFTKLELLAHYDQPLGRRFSMQVQVEGQIASRALLASEEMGLGGRYMLRGYDYRERSGDDGVAGAVELRYDLASPPRPLKAVQVYVYGDAGVVGNDRAGAGGGSLASAGGGIRLRVGKVDGSLELGVPLQRRLRGDRDPRFSFTLGTRF